MSASVSAMRGGQPSTTQPIAGPWLSPKVVTRKRWPNVLKDMGFQRVPGCRSPAAGWGQMGGTFFRMRGNIRDDRSSVPHQPRFGEHIHHALVDRVVHRLVRRL